MQRSCFPHVLHVKVWYFRQYVEPAKRDPPKKRNKGKKRQEWWEERTGRKAPRSAESEAQEPSKPSVSGGQEPSSSLSASSSAIPPWRRHEKDVEQQPNRGATTDDLMRAVAAQFEVAQAILSVFALVQIEYNEVFDMSLRGRA